MPLPDCQLGEKKRKEANSLLRFPYQSGIITLGSMDIQPRIDECKRTSYLIMSFQSI
jgi:hypothetical protein